MPENNNKKKMGRPIGYRAENPKNQPMPKVMLTESQLNAYKAASKASGKTFSEWVRNCLDNNLDNNND